MKTEKRMVCFIAAAVLLILTLWFTSCGATTAEAGAERKPCYHVTVYSPEIEKLAMPVGVSRSTPLPWRTLASCCLTQSYLLSVSISSCKSLWKMAALNWCLPRW